jgi:hypothetical protein
MKHLAPHAPPSHTWPPPQLVPFATLVCWHTPALSHSSAVHALLSSVHATPEDLCTTVHPPSPSHVELVSQAPGVQVKAVPPHVPLVHTSVFVQALLSSHVVPSFFAGFEQVPVA